MTRSEAEAAVIEFERLVLEAHHKLATPANRHLIVRKRYELAKALAAPKLSAAEIKDIGNAAARLKAAGEAIEDKGDDMRFDYDGIDTDHIGFSIDCQNSVSCLEDILTRAESDR